MVEYGEGEEVVVVTRVSYNSNLEIESWFPGTRGSLIFPYTPRLRVPQKETRVYLFPKCHPRETRARARIQ